ncbi:MAG TPA: phospho-N-acetylmuramoyl-pentapeptide-transferase [bacterium]|nr:phospho-N-acetylmuramoyl-pentapeptide-transferase [bacterium]
MRSLLAIAGVSFLLGFVLQKILMVLLSRLKMRQIIREQGPEAHLKKSGTLTMGGVAFFIAWLVSILCITGVSEPKIRMIVIVSSIMFLLGLLDDIAKFLGKKTEGVKARYKLIIEIALGILIGLFMVWQGSIDELSIDPSLIWTPRWFDGISMGWTFIPFVVVVFVGTVNSTNLADGLDGLLAGCYLVVAAAFIYLINKYGDRTLLPVLVASMGSVAAFLWFNSNPAKIFAGDTGSLFLGGLLASVAIVARLELFLLVAGGLFVAEALSVMIQVVCFRLTGKRVLKMAPLHHHFELSGWSEPQVVVRFWMVSAALSAVAVWMFIR